MSVLCKIGLHRWKAVGAAGLFLFPLDECRRCGAGKVNDYMAGASIIAPEDMERSAMIGVLREARKRHEREIDKAECVAVKGAHRMIVDALDRMADEHETGGQR